MKQLIILFLVAANLATAQIAPINRGGLKYERVAYVAIPAINSISGSDSIPAIIDTTETGRIVGVEVFLPPNPSINIPHIPSIELISVIEEVDLEMIVQARINYYDSTGTRLMSSVIDADTSLTVDAKAMRKQLFQSYVLAPKSTRGSYINPATGALLTNGDTSSSVREIQFYQNLTADMLGFMGVNVVGESRVQFIRYKMLAFILNSFVTRYGL